MTEREVYELQKRIALSYEWFEITEDRVHEWHVHLADHDADAVNVRLNEHIASGRRTPSVADMVPVVTVNAAVMAGQTAIREVEEWEKKAVPPPQAFYDMLDRLRKQVKGNV